MLTPPETSAEAPPAQRVALTGRSGIKRSVKVTTNRDVMALIAAEVEAAGDEMRRHLAVEPGTVIGVHVWAIVTEGEHAGALVAVTGIRQFLPADGRAHVEAIGLARTGLRWLHLPMATLRRAYHPDRDAPAVLLEDLGW